MPIAYYNLRKFLKILKKQEKKKKKTFDVIYAESYSNGTCQTLVNPQVDIFCQFGKHQLISC